MAKLVFMSTLVRYAMLSSRYFSFDGSNNQTGYLKYNGLPLQVSGESEFLQYRVLSKLCGFLTGSKEHPLFKLTTRQLPTGNETYKDHDCVQTCYDVYLECNDFDFRRDETGDLRLYFEGQWSAVCRGGDYFTFLTYKRKKICSDLGLPSVSVTRIPGSRGDYTKSWIVTDTCDYVWSTLGTCNFTRYIEEHDCPQEDLVAFHCDPFIPVLAMSDWGYGGHRGIVDFEQKNGNWRSISTCPGFSTKDAAVVCRTLGYPSSDANFNFKFMKSDYFRGIDGNFECNGTENSLTECSNFPKVNYRVCNRWYAAEISCDDASEGKLRLAGGLDGVSGQLEIYHNNTWGRVCGSGFGQTEINVACHQITNGRVGQGTRIARPTEAEYNEVDFIMSGVQCLASDTRLDACTHNPWGDGSCGSNDTVFISCSEKLQYRLSGGTTGRLEVYHDSQWGGVCREGFTSHEVKIVCNSLNLTRAYPKLWYGSSQPESGRVRLESLKCGDWNDGQVSCQPSPWGAIDYFKCFNIVHMNCTSIADEVAASLRLSESYADNIGSVEVKHLEMGGVCMASSSDKIAEVVCRSLGLPVENAVVLPAKMFLYSQQPTILNGVRCTGTETSLFDCSYTSMVREECDPLLKLAVGCGGSVGADYSLRLVDSSATGSGILEVRLHDIWGRVCYKGFDTSAAKVACRQLGFGVSSATAYSVGHSRYSNGPMWMTEIICLGKESRLEDCLKTMYPDPACYGEAGVRCSTDIPNTSSSSGPPLPAVIVGCILAGVALTAVVIGIICCNKQRARSSPPVNSVQQPGRPLAGQIPPQAYQQPAFGQPVYNVNPYGNPAVIVTSTQAPYPPSTKNEYTNGTVVQETHFNGSTN